MSMPFVLVTTHRIVPGARERFEQVSREYLDFVEANEPQVLAHVAYVDGAGSEVALVQVHPDAASADHHLQLVAPLLQAASDLVENVAIDVYGEPGPMLRAAVDHNAESGVAVWVAGEVLGGFARLAAAS